MSKSKKPNIKTLKLFVGSETRGQSGPSATGIVITNNNGDIHESWGWYTGYCTTTKAGLQGLIRGLELCREYQPDKVRFRSSDINLINQLKRCRRLSHEKLEGFDRKLKWLMSDFKVVKYKHLERDDIFMLCINSLTFKALDTYFSERGRQRGFR